jgi:cytochrome b pre-mRNA-processing protein 3
MGLFRSAAARQRESMVDGLYAKAVAQARLPVFYAEWGVPDSLDGRFDLLSLHMFLLLHRLGHAGREGKPIAQDLFDLMFGDMDRSLREMGVGDMSVGKRVKDMVRAFYGRIEAYEQGLQGEEAMIAALSRNLYRGAEVPAETLQTVARYVLAQWHAIAALAIDDMDEPFGAPA